MDHRARNGLEDIKQLVEQRAVGADAQPAEIENPETGAAPGSNPRDAGDDIDVVIEGGADKGSDLVIVAVLRILPVMEAVDQLLKA